MTLRPRWITLLGRVGLFRDCSDCELTQVGSLLTIERVEAGALLTSEDAPRDAFFLVHEGYARACREGAKLGVIGPGSFLGEGVLRGEGPAAATVQAITPVTVYVLERDRFQAFLGEDEDWRERLGRRSDRLGRDAAPSTVTEPVLT